MEALPMRLVEMEPALTTNIVDLKEGGYLPLNTHKAYNLMPLLTPFYFINNTFHTQKAIVNSLRV